MRRFVPALTISALLLAAHHSSAAPAKSCVFKLSMTSGVDVNNLDFKVNYAGAGGTVGGSEGRAECSKAVGGTAFAGFHDDDAAQKLIVNIIRLPKFSAPTDLAGCRFFYNTVPPLPSAFSVTVTNAGSGGFDDNIIPLPVVKVTSVECPGNLPSPTTTLPEESTTTTLPDAGDCGFPLSGSGPKPTIGDALAALRGAVLQAGCLSCLCDVNSDGTVGVGDALRILKASVGLTVVLDCPAC